MTYPGTESIFIMATPGKPLPSDILAGLRRLLREKVPKARAAKLMGVHRMTVWRHIKRGTIHDLESSKCDAP